MFHFPETKSSSRQKFSLRVPVRKTSFWTIEIIVLQFRSNCGAFLTVRSKWNWTSVPVIGECLSKYFHIYLN